MISIRRWWIVKWKYPFFKAKVDGMEEDTADHLFNHPNLLVFVVTRYLVYLSQYCTAFGIKIEQFLDATFPPGALTMTMKTEDLPNNGTKIVNYNIIIRSVIPKNWHQPTEDKYAVTNLEVDVEARDFKISQTCYDTNDPSKAAASQVIYSKEFQLQRDGTLYNPNYSLSKELLQDDLDYYKLMISQLLLFIGGILEASTIILFLEPKPENERIL